jgi:hypothetical protein
LEVIPRRIHEAKVFRSEFIAEIVRFVTAQKQLTACYIMKIWTDQNETCQSKEEHKNRYFILCRATKSTRKVIGIFIIQSTSTTRNYYDEEIIDRGPLSFTNLNQHVKVFSKNAADRFPTGNTL